MEQPPPETASAGGASLEPLPEGVSIPAVLVEDWLSLPPDAVVSLELRRADLDHFYNSINRSLEAQWAFQDCMIDFTAGRLDAANGKLRIAQRRLVEGQNALRQLMTAIMAGSTRGRRT
jgi:hypothetical protein